MCATAGSRPSPRAIPRKRGFAETFGIPRFYEDLVRDRAVDAVYVATPASAHKDNALLAVNEGIAVLCEKPLTVTGREAEDLIKQARLNGTFLMEAMWTRFIPAIVRFREILARCPAVPSAVTPRSHTHTHTNRSCNRRSFQV